MKEFEIVFELAGHVSYTVHANSREEARTIAFDRAKKTGSHPQMLYGSFLTDSVNSECDTENCIVSELFVKADPEITPEISEAEL